MCKRFMAFQVLHADAYYGPRIAALPREAANLIVAELEKTAGYSPDDFAVHVRNLFIDQKIKPKYWGAVDEILQVCGSKAKDL